MPTATFFRETLHALVGDEKYQRLAENFPEDDAGLDEYLVENLAILRNISHALLAVRLWQYDAKQLDDLRPGWSFERTEAAEADDLQNLHWQLDIDEFCRRPSEDENSSEEIARIESVLVEVFAEVGMSAELIAGGLDATVIRDIALFIYRLERFAHFTLKTAEGYLRGTVFLGLAVGDIATQAVYEVETQTVIVRPDMLTEIIDAVRSADPERLREALHNFKYIFFHEVFHYLQSFLSQYFYMISVYLSSILKQEIDRRYELEAQGVEFAAGETGRDIYLTIPAEAEAHRVAAAISDLIRDLWYQDNGSDSIKPIAELLERVRVLENWLQEDSTDLSYTLTILTNLVAHCADLVAVLEALPDEGQLRMMVSETEYQINDDEIIGSFVTEPGNLNIVTRANLRQRLVKLIYFASQQLSSMKDQILSDERTFQAAQELSGQIKAVHTALKHSQSA